MTNKVKRSLGQKTRLFLDYCCFCGLLGQIHPRSLIQKVSLGAKSFLLVSIWVSTQRSKFPRARQLLILTWCENTRAQKPPTRSGGLLVQEQGPVLPGARLSVLQPGASFGLPRAVHTAPWQVPCTQLGRASLYSQATDPGTSCLPCKTPAAKYTSPHCICSVDHSSGYFTTPSHYCTWGF